MKEEILGKSETGKEKEQMKERKRKGGRKRRKEGNGR